MEPTVPFTQGSAQLQELLDRAESVLLEASAAALPSSIQNALASAAPALGSSGWALWLEAPGGDLSFCAELSKPATEQLAAAVDAGRTVPLGADTGKLVFHVAHPTEAWTGDTEQMARRLGLMVGRAVARLQWERFRAPLPTTLPHEQTGLLQATLDGLVTDIGLTDDQGCLVMVNQAWERAALRDNVRSGVPLGLLGQNYLEICDSARLRCIEAGIIADAARAMLRGEQDQLRLEYPADNAHSPSWFQVRIARFQSGGRMHLIFAHEDLTHLKMVEERERALSRRLMHVQDEERKRIADDLHDGAAQNVFAAMMGVSRVRKSVTDSRAEQTLAETEELCRDALKQIRTVSYLLHPALLDEAGLVPALNTFLAGFNQRSGITTRLTVPNLGRLSTDVERGIFRVVQEALANVQRHSAATEVEVRLWLSEAELHLSIRDNGRGMKAAEKDHASGVGLGSMRERVHQLCGTLSVISAESGGTEVRVTVPPVAPGPQTQGA